MRESDRELEAKDEVKRPPLLQNFWEKQTNPSSSVLKPN